MTPVADIRKDYKLKKLSRENCLKNAFEQFDLWWKEAVDCKIDEVNAMTLATASPDGLPDARIVLLKGISPGGFHFFTNYNSAKGKQLAVNPRASLVFFWKELERQVRIVGTVAKISPEESDEYYISRPLGSRIGAWASPQSEVIKSSGWLAGQAAALEEKYTDGSIPRPPYWGGYNLVPSSIEFWQGRPNRLHDRLLYKRGSENSWLIERLAP